jgi:hypothetical protein
MKKKTGNIIKNVATTILLVVNGLSCVFINSLRIRIFRNFFKTERNLVAFFVNNLLINNDSAACFFAKTYELKKTLTDINLANRQKPFIERRHAELIFD